MAYKFREEIVGKRFLSVSSHIGKLKVTKISDWDWRSGIVRATSHKDPKHPDLTVLIEFDDTDWKRREWVRLYDDSEFHLFVVENTLVWTSRKETAVVGLPSRTNLYWPSLTFTSLVDKVGLCDNRLQPVEYLVDKELWFVDYADIIQYQEQDTEFPPANRDFAEVQRAIRQWTEYQDGQHILVTTPSILVGYRVEVYRVEGTTQWYTAVIISYNHRTKQLTLTDDTVLEEHNENPCLVQMRLIGEGVVDSILRGVSVGMTPRRRVCANPSPPPAYYSTRNRSHHSANLLALPSRYLSATRITSCPIQFKKTRSQPSAAVSYPPRENADIGESSSAVANYVPEKESTYLSSASTSQEQGDTFSESSNLASTKAKHHKCRARRRRKHSRYKRASTKRCLKDVVEEGYNSRHLKSCRNHICLIGEIETDCLKPICCDGCSPISEEKVPIQSQFCTKSIKKRSKKRPRSIRIKSKKSDPKNSYVRGTSISAFAENNSDDCAIIQDDFETSTTVQPLKGISSNISSLSVVLTPLSPSVVSAVVNPKSNYNSDTRLTADDNSCDNISHSEELIKCSENLITSNSFTEVADDSVECISDSVAKSANDSITEWAESSVPENTKTFLTNYDENLTSQNSELILSECVDSSVIDCDKDLILECSEDSVIECSKNSVVEYSDDSNLSTLFSFTTVNNLLSNDTEISLDLDCNASDENSCGFKEEERNDLCQQTTSNDDILKERDISEDSFSAISLKLSDNEADNPKEPDNTCHVITATYTAEQLYTLSNIKQEPLSDTEEEYNSSYNNEAPQKEFIDARCNYSDIPRQHSVDALNALNSNTLNTALNFNNQYYRHQSIIVNPGYQNGNFYNSNPVENSSPFNRSTNAPSHNENPTPSVQKTGNLQNAFLTGMSELDKLEKSLIEKSNVAQQSQVTSHPPSNICQASTSESQVPPRNISEQVDRAEEKNNASNIHVDHPKTVKTYGDPLHSNQSVHHVDLHPGLMHPAGISHSAAAAAAAAAGVYPSVPPLPPQHNRAPAPPLPPSNIGPYSLSPHLLQPPHVGNVGGTSAPTAPHMEQHAATMHSQAYRHMLTQHPLMPPQYGSTGNPHVGLDLMWQQKYNPNPWVVYEELRLERERAVAQDRERTRIDRDRDLERIEKAEREKAEKERIERERAQKERLEREERERVQREAVHQHFEESLRLVLQKQLQKTVGWSPMTNLPLPKSQPAVGSSSPTVSLPQRMVHSQELDREKVREKEKERISSQDIRLRHEHERWLAAVQRGEQAIAHSSYPQNYSVVEGRSGTVPVKDVYSMPRGSSHGAPNPGHMPKPGVSPSPVASNIPSSNIPSQHKTETNFSLYGYQPFQHTYITQAQLKAREDSKMSNSMQPILITGKMLNSAASVKQERDIVYDGPSNQVNRNDTSTTNSNSTKQVKVVHQIQDRGSSMYQPLVGGGGAFKPYEYSTNSSAPPAHQNSSSPTLASRVSASQYHNSQDQPQNLVKVDHKANQESSIHSNQRFELRDMRQTVSTPPCSIPSSCTPPYSISKSVSPAANSNFSYSLIQQGLVPNPLYIAATHGNPNTSSATSQPMKALPLTGSPPIPQQYLRGTSVASITSGTPACRSNSVLYTVTQTRNAQNFSPVGPLSQTTAVSNRPCPQEAHAANRGISTHMSIHRSPSPAHMYGQPLSSAIPPGSIGSPHNSRRPCSPIMSNPAVALQFQNMHKMVMQPIINGIPISPPINGSPDSQITPLNLQGNSKSKRKSADINCKKRSKTDEHLIPPQLQPQVHRTSTSPDYRIGSLSHLSLDSAITSTSHEHHIGTVIQNSFIHENSPSLRLDSSSPPSLVMPNLMCTSNSVPISVNSNLALDGACSTPNVVTEGSVNHAKSLKLQIISENSALESVDLLNRSVSNTGSAISTSQSTLGTSSHEGGEESRLTVSPASSASSTITTSSGTCCSSNHTKLKKAWLQRHSENEDKKILIESSKLDSPVKAAVDANDDTKNLITSSKPSPDIQDTKSNASDDNSAVGQEIKPPKLEALVEDDSTSSASEIEEVKHMKRKLRISRKQGSPANIKKQKLCSSPNDVLEEVQQLKKDKKKSNLADKEVSSKKRGRKTKGRNASTDDAMKKKSSKSLEKPSVSQLKKTGEAFLQDGPCCEVAPRLPKCRECRMTAHQRSKKMPNIFCRFYAYRKLRYSKNGTVSGAGFSEPSDATEDDMKLWLPPIDSPPSDIEIETSKFLLTHIGDQFCDLVEMEKEAQSMHVSETSMITWKRVVQGVREMCDVCETTLFNFHWVCHKCGFVVCIDCYKTRKNGVWKGDDSLSKDRDHFQWLLCTNRQAHEQEKLMLTQIIANTALWDVGKILHEVRRIWNIPTYCSCSVKDGEDGKHSANGICKLMSAVTKCFSSDKDVGQVNGIDDSSRSSKKNGKNSSANGVKQEDGMSGYSSESGGSPLSWLADVALNSSSKAKDEKNKIKEECGDNISDSQRDEVESDDEKSENFSTLRELLIRPMGKMGNKSSGTDSSSQKTLTSTLDEVISCVIEQRVRKSDKKCNEKQLLHFTRRHQLLRSGRELLPIRSCMLTESSLLYPEIPHVWLGSGKILLLTNPSHSGNVQLFQEQWKRGQPVIVANVGQKLDESLWTPNSFLQEFGDVKGDFQNCVTGKSVMNQPMKKFWEGFENPNKRMKDEEGESMVLKLKDWPPVEEFSDLLPSRYQDFVQVLPLPQYTQRNGMFNMASRLPECFVKPDLGPRMYNAYGLSASCEEASTNLHLDVSDAVNVLTYINIDDDDSVSDIKKSLEENGCDISMKKRGLEDEKQVGAIWHVYNARDADKIRDLLNKVTEEQGTKCDPHNDPIHNQEWYLNESLRTRLLKEYGVEGYAIAQCFGDAIFIPAGSPHQVRNLRSCIKVSEDFVSPESVSHTFFLTQEIRNLSDGPFNHEDKLQIKNIIYHAVKDALALLQSNDPEDAKS